MVGDDLNANNDVARRLQTEFQYLKMEKSLFGPYSTLTWSKSKENCFIWLVNLDGLGLYKNGRYQIEIKFTVVSIIVQMKSVSIF